MYSEIDSNPLFKGTTAIEDRSNMNVTFVLNDDSHTDEWNNIWNEAGIVGLKGHRDVGGYRASMYNALTIDSVKVLTDLMSSFAQSKA